MEDERTVEAFLLHFANPLFADGVCLRYSAGRYQRLDTAAGDRDEMTSSITVLSILTWHMDRAAYQPVWAMLAAQVQWA
jgi:hypothetical protein